MNEYQRFERIIKFLIANKKVRNQQHFVEEIHSDKATVSQIKNGKMKIPNNMFANIETAFPDISSDWLKTGKGEMIKSNQTEHYTVVIGKKLKQFFDCKQLTQQSVAERLGVSQAAVSALLNGKPFGKNLSRKWGDVFGLNPNWLLTGEGEMLKNTNENNVPENGNASVADDGNQITTSLFSEMLKLQKGYQEMLKTSQAQISSLISIIEKKYAI
jgi:transcriptional regulator with XRE-family HTH domain